MMRQRRRGSAISTQRVRSSDSPTEHEIPLGQASRQRRSLALGLLVSLAGCSAAPTPAAPHPGAEEVETREQPSRELDCADSIDAFDDLEEYPDYTQLLDAVALPSARADHEPLQSVAQEGPTEFEYFAKFGLLTRGDASARINVDDPDRARISWGNFSEDSDVVELHLPGCGGGGWHAFPGGVRTTEPMCLSLTVASNGQHETVELALGTSCEHAR